ncbi:beta-glucosidase family protein [Oceanitalea stevensii]|uniref:beta-glucosidase family protein n=1 Tax=Oceanitalea stevensii TaxID=2763072 RepID=UPI002044E514|nr:glycoside hydrolase family 3 C-terminal domain-containing protein [Oceanitalea stevensii]
MDTSLSPEERADLLIDAMTLDQKIQQISNEPVYNEDLDVDGDPDTDDRTRWDCDFTPVGRHIEGIPELGIPDFRQANGGTGIRGGDCVPEPVATALPAQVASAATFNSDIAYEWGELLDVELRSWAHHALWGPGMNLIRTPYGGRNNEYFSEDPYLTGVMASEIIRGVQARGVSHATAKHFAANESEYQFERWTSANRVPSRAMHELYLLPFEMAVKDADVASIMCAYPHVNHSYNCDSIPLLQDTLRDRWGFDGYVYSDRRAQQSTVASVLAGVNVELDETAEWYTPELIKAAIADGEITEEHIDGLLRERYIVMFEYGDFEDPHTEFLWDELDPLIERGGEHAELAKQAAAESLVLLRNDEDVLPLDADAIDSIALIGAEWFAGEATLPPRSGNREENISVIEPYQVTPEEGLEEVLEDLDSDATVTYNSGDSTAEAVELVEDSDVTILMIGDVARETWDKNSNWREENPGGGTNGAENEIPDIDLPSVEGTNQVLLIERVLDADPDTIVVAKTQGQVNMPRLEDMHTLVQAWYPGQEDGAVVAEALFGVTNFSGKLPVTIGSTDREAAFATELQYPGRLEDTGVPGGIGRDPLCNDEDETPPCEESGPAPQRVVRYLENLEMGYRWYQANDLEPEFPFGFGLSYTTFEYSDLSVTTSQTGGSHSLHIDFTVTNTGDVAGAEAAQVYLTLPAEAEEPPKRLVGFDKPYLEPGESERVSVVLDESASNHPLSYFAPDHPNDLARWAEGDWVTPEGTFTVHAGSSSADTPLTQDVVLEAEEPPAQRYGFFLSNDWTGTAHYAFQYGRWTDEVLIGDWNGDGTDSITVRRGADYFVSNAPRGGDADRVFRYGRPDDVVLVGDWDGNGVDTLAVRRGKTYHVKNSLRGGDADAVIQYGRTNDAVVVGDWDGNGTDTFAVRRGATYYVKNSLRGGAADRVFVYGRADDITWAGDWDGDGRDTFAIQRGRVFHVNNSLSGGPADFAITYGRVGDEVLVGDWNGDGRDSLGVRRAPAVD